MLHTSIPGLLFPVADTGYIESTLADFSSNLNISFLQTNIRKTHRPCNVLIMSKNILKNINQCYVISVD